MEYIALAILVVLVWVGGVISGYATGYRSAIKWNRGH